MSVIDVLTDVGVVGDAGVGLQKGIEDTGLVRLNVPETA
ncbi:Uncharacterised protein [Mycobacteroides abscessus]|nr:Uncharacterised protein [Mycobacteroides abscessus]